MTVTTTHASPPCFASLPHAHGTTGQTNIWDGILKSLEAMGGDDAPTGAPVEDGTVGGRMRSVFVLTDGMPTKSPVRGNVKEFERYATSRGSLPAHVHFFGFGYSLKSDELVQLARIGGGNYSFIPDEGMVGTAFTNAVANCGAVCSSDVLLEVTAPYGVASVLRGAQGGTGSGSDTGDFSVQLGQVQFGQTKDWVLEGPTESLQAVTARATVIGGNPNEIVASLEAGVGATPTPEGEADSTGTGNGNGTCGGGRDDDAEALAEWYRSKAVALMEKVTACTTGPTARATWENPASQALLDGLKASAHPRTQALSEDLHGQIELAISTDAYFKKWGLHFTRSNMMAHRRQECNNFKDPGVQVYGGKFVKDLCDVASDVFDNLEAPALRLPMATAYAHATAAAGGVIPSAPVIASMATINSSGRPCFAPDTNVSLSPSPPSTSGDRPAKEPTKRIQDLRRGDRVLLPDGGSAVVRCLVKNVCKGGVADLVQLKNGGALITPYHPVLDEKARWRFPCDLAPMQKDVSCEAVYNVVLESGHIILINGTPCCTLGHGFVDNDVIAHGYFGTEAVVKDLAKLPGWEDGLIVSRSYSEVRDEVTGMVTRATFA